MKLIICEKPSVAKSIASALDVTSRADGYFENGEWLISWCIGHLVGLADAAAYDDRYKKWRYEDLPILPNPILFGWLSLHYLLFFGTAPIGSLIWGTYFIQFFARQKDI